MVETEVRTDVTAEALAATLDELERLRNQAISAKELDEAKNYLAGRFTRRLETQEQVADQFLTMVIYELPDDYLRTYVQRIQAVTAEQAQRAAQAHITPDRELVVVVGDVEKIEAKLANYSAGVMTVFNDKGDKIGAYPPEGVRRVVRP
jgi:zinc protease